MSSRAFHPRLRIWFGLLAATLLTLAIALYVALALSSAKSARVEKSQEILTKLRSAASKYDEGMISLRGFAASREERQLEAYRRAVIEVTKSLGELRLLTAEDRGLGRRLSELEDLMRQRADLDDRMMAVQRAEGLESALRYGNAEGLTPLITRIWSLMSLLQAEQKGQLCERIQAVSAEAWSTFLSFAVAISGSLVIIGLAFGYTERQVRKRVAADATLRQSEAWFRGTFKAATVGMGVLSLDGRWLEVNPALCAIVGYTEGELLSMDFPTITHPDDRASDLQRYTRARVGETNLCQFEVRYIHKAGHVIHVSVSGSVVRGDSGRSATFVAVIVDITAKKRAESRLAAQHAVAIVVSESESFDCAIRSLLKAIGESMNYVVGEFWQFDESVGQLRAEGEWRQACARAPRLSEWSRILEFLPGEGLPGNVWQRGQAIVLEEVGDDPIFLLGDAAVVAGLRSAYGFPIAGALGPIGVMTFLSEDKAYDDEALRASFYTLGRQIGLFVERRRVEEAAQAAERRFRAIFDNTLQFIGLLDPEGILLEGNRTALEFCGTTREAVIGLPFWEGPWWNGDIGLQDRLRTAILDAAAGQFVRFEADHPGKNGSSMTVDFSLTPVRDETGAVVLLVPEGHDITALKRAAEALSASEEQFRLLVEGVPDHAILMLDPNGRIVSWNEAAKRMTGCEAEDAIGQHFSVFCADDELPISELNEHLAIARDEGRWKGEGWRKRKDGSLFWAEILISPVNDSDGRLRGFAKVTRDITERRQVEEVLRAAKEAAEAANRAKGEFLANMSHEIRTPMNGIIGMTELALETPLSSVQREYLLLVNSSADSLLTVINEILDFSKIDAGKMELSPTNFRFRELVEETVKTLALRAAGKGLSLECEIEAEIPDLLFGDGGRLRQVIVNLLGNAIKFTEQGSVALRAELRRMDEVVYAARIHFSVSDTGVGIAREKLSKIFDPFEQADNSTTRRFGGTGLGLAISRKLVSLMGGEIWVESEAGHGATFHFTTQFELPIRNEKSGQAAGTTVARMGAPEIDEVEPNGSPRVGWIERPTAAKNGCLESGQPKALRVLIAEDHPVNQKLAARLLEKAGHTVTLVDNGLLAVDAVVGGEFDLVLMDVQMPVMDGIEAIAQIRGLSEPAKSRIPVIALTAHAMRGDRDRCLAAGFDGYLSKPVSRRSLMDAIGRLVGSGDCVS